MAKKIKESNSIRIYGPYPSKTDATKWTVHIWLTNADRAIIIPTEGFNLKPVFDCLSNELLRRLVDRARAQGTGNAPEEPLADMSEDD